MVSSIESFNMPAVASELEQWAGAVVRKCVVFAVKSEFGSDDLNSFLCHIYLFVCFLSFYDKKT